MDIIERYEHKFLIPEQLVPEIRSFARTISRIDRYAGTDGTYTIRSLYFDTPTLDVYWADDEQRCRLKVRVRMYPGAESRYFLEVKRRTQDVIVKSRAAVPADRLRAAIDGDSATLDTLSPQAQAAVLRVRRGGLRVRTLHDELLLGTAPPIPKELDSNDVDTTKKGIQK
jgi:hypothetical protein